MKKITTFILSLICLNILADEIEEITILGTYLQNGELDSSPVELISKKRFDDFNISSIAEISKFISAASGSHFQTNALGGQDQGMASITLRGLDHSSTLILINSKRQTFAGTAANDGEGYIDVNIIPEIAIQRIEILKEGATSLYGSDAIAGVINFQLIEQFKGMKLDIKHQDTDNYSQTDNNIGILFGNNVFGFDLVAGLQFLNRSSLPARSIDGIAELALSGLGKTFRIAEADTVSGGLYSGTYAAGQFVPDPNCESNGGILDGNFCRFLYGNRFNVVNDEDHQKIYGTISRQLGNLYFQSTIIESSIDVNDNPQSPSYPALPFLSRNILPSQGGSPFNVPVRWYGRPLGSEYPSPYSPKDINQFHWSNKVIIDLSDISKLEIAFTKSEHENNHYRPDVIDSRFLNALNGLGGINGDLTWDIFDSNQIPDSLIDYVKGAEISNKKASQDIIDVIFLSQMSGFDLALGLQYLEDDLEIYYDDLSRVVFDNDGQFIKSADLFFLGGGKNVSASRNKRALFFELSRNYFSSIDLRLAGRFEDFDTGSSFDPKISLKYKVNNLVSIRASMSESFSMPSMAQMFSSEVQLGSVRDTSNVFVRQAQLGNPNLKPATSENLNLGLLINALNYKFSLDYWEIDYENRIEAQSAQALLNENPNGPAITRNVDGDLIGVTTTYFNEESTEVAGIDLDLSYSFPINKFGDFDIRIVGTNLIKFSTPLVESGVSKMQNRVGRFNYDSHMHSLPRNRINLFFGINGKNFRHQLNTRYIDSYKNTRAITGLGLTYGYKNKVDSFVVHDYCLKSSETFTPDFFNGKLNFGFCIININDESAPQLYDAPDFSFDTRLHDPRGRMFSINFNLEL